MATDKVKRSFIWLRRTLGIIDKTTLPGEINGEVRPTVDTFGWDRLAPEGAGAGPATLSTTGGAAADIIVFAAVPTGVMRYVMYASVSHNDPVAGGLLLSLQIRAPSSDIGLQDPFQCLAQPARVGLSRPILMAPGEILLARSVPAPAVATSMFAIYRFVDIDFGEYIPPL